MFIVNNRSCTTPSQNISPHSDSSGAPTSSDLVKIVVKTERNDESCGDQAVRSGSSHQSRDYSDIQDDVQEMPEDLTLSSSSVKDYRFGPSGV